MQQLKLEWIIANQVALATGFPTNVTNADFNVMIDMMRHIFEESSSDQIHYINDLSSVQSVPTSLSSLTQVTPLLRNKRLASVTIVGKLQNPLVQILAKTLARSLTLYFERDVLDALTNLAVKYPELQQTQKV